MRSNLVRPQSRCAYPRFALATVVLALYTSLALATGAAAHADPNSTHSGNSSSHGSPRHESKDGPSKKRDTKNDTSNEDKPKSDATKDTPEKATSTPGRHRRPIHHAPNGSGPDDESTDANPPEDGTAATKPPPDRPSAETTTHTTTPTASTPRPRVGATTRHADTAPSKEPADVTRPSLPTPKADDARTTPERRQSVDGEVAVTAPTAPSLPSAHPSVKPAPTAAALAIVPSPKDPTLQPNIVHQVTGLVVDIGAFALSTLHSVAAVTAQAFGPHALGGAPYLLATSIANAAAGAARSLAGVSENSTTTGRFTVPYGLLDALAFFDPTKPPAGANDPTIHVTPEHPLPIIMLNGTAETQGFTWSVGAPALANVGYKVYTFNYGNLTPFPNFPVQSVADIRVSGQELAAEVDRVLALTGAPKVILVGHSQGGGILPSYYINELGGADKVSQLIGIAPSNHGTDINGFTALMHVPILGQLAIGIANLVAPGLVQQILGSAFQQTVYGGGDTRGNVLYTMISSINDEVVTPYTQQALIGPNVTNVVLQQQYPGAVIGHGSIITNPLTWSAVLDALASNAQANPDLVEQTSAA